MSGHTPGPWTMGVMEEDGPWCVGNSECVALAKMTGAPGPHHEANARLIAAAPELLEALEKIASEESTTWDEDLMEHVPVPMDEEEMAEIARNAIAKATGKD